MNAEVRGAVRPRTVCHLIASNFFGGPEKQIVEHGAALDSSRWRAVVGSFRENRDEVGVTRNAGDRGIETFLVDTRSSFSPGSVFQLQRSLRKTGADVLVTHGYKATVVGTLAAAMEQLPHVVVIRGYTGEDWKVRIYEGIDRWLVKRARHVVCVSEATRKSMIALGVRPERVETVHNAVVLPEHVPGSAGLRNRFGISAGIPLILAVGRLSTEKGHRFLLSALAILSRRGSPAHLVLVGEGREREALEKQARAEGIADRVHFAGFRTDVLACMKESDLLVNPSSTEGLPNVVLEALATGIPVVATNVGGTGELVVPGRTGWLVPPGEPGVMADAIREVLDAEDSGRSLAAAGTKVVQDHFTFPSQAEQWMKLYDQVAGGSQ